MTMSEGRKKVLVGTGIIIFWIICFSQIILLREDYPFSYFGMYKYGESGIEYILVEVKIYKGEIKQNRSMYIRDPFSFTDKIRRIVLHEIKAANDFMVQEANGKLFGLIKDSQKKEIIDLFKKQLLDENLLLYQPRLIVNLKRWEKLGYKNSKTPTEEIVIIDQVVKDEAL